MIENGEGDSLYLLSFAFLRRKEDAMIAVKKKSTTRDMTTGSIGKQILTKLANL